MGQALTFAHINSGYPDNYMIAQGYFSHKTSLSFKRNLPMNKSSVFFLISALGVLFLINCASSNTGNNINKDNEGLETKPDLVSNFAGFNDAGFLTFDIANQGNADIENPELAWVHVYVNERFVARFNVQNDIPAIISAETSTNITTGFQMRAGENRISVIVDPDDLIDELNEMQNSTHGTYLGEGEDPEVNLKIKDLDRNLTAALLIVEVENTGNADLENPASATFRIVKNNQEESFFETELRALAVGESQRLLFGVGVSESDNIEVSIMLNSIEETSLADNRRAEFPVRLNEDFSENNGLRIPEYEDLILNPEILPFINWESPNGIQNYRDWHITVVNELFTLLQSLENNDTEVLESIPEPDILFFQDRRIDETTARHIYLRHLAVTLWVEKSNLVDWSLFDYSDELKSNLLDSRETFNLELTNKYAFKFKNNERVNSWNPKMYHDFLRMNRLVKSDQRATIDALMRWIIGHYVHIDYRPLRTYADVYGTENFLIPLRRVIYPMPETPYFSPSGCWGVSASLRAFLRTVNIPVQESISLFPGGADFARHSRPIFLTEGLTFPHGDDVYDGRITQSGNLVPMDDFFITLAEYEAQIGNPTVQCNGDDCNNIYEQARYNMSRAKLLKALQFKTDGILHLYNPENNQDLENMLTTSYQGSSPVLYAFPFFQEDARAAHIESIRMALEEIGEGDLELGLQKVRDRIDKWRAFRLRGYQ